MPAILSPRLVRFGIAGLISTLSYLLLAIALALLGTLPDAVSSALAYLISLGISYGLQSRMVFRVNGDSATQLSRFLATAIAGFALATGIVYVCSDQLGWPTPVGTILVCILIPLANYLLFKGWVFVAPRHEGTLENSHE